VAASLAHVGQSERDPADLIAPHPMRTSRSPPHFRAHATTLRQPVGSEPPGGSQPRSTVAESFRFASRSCRPRDDASDRARSRAPRSRHRSRHPWMSELVLRHLERRGLLPTRLCLRRRSGYGCNV
jgi:hypothetical protein